MKISSGVFVPIPGLEMVFRYLGPQRLYPDGPDIRLSFHQPVNWAFNDLGSKYIFFCILCAHRVQPNRANKKENRADWSNALKQN
jgi:hypothetical protein